MSQAPRLLALEVDEALEGLVRSTAAELGFQYASARGESEFRALYERGGSAALYLDLQQACDAASGVLRYLAGQRVPVPILLVTGRDAAADGDPAREAQALGLPVVAVLRGPFDRSALKSALGKLLPPVLPVDPNTVARAIARGDFELEFEPRVQLRDMHVLDLRAHVLALPPAADGHHATAGADLVESAEQLELGRPLTEHILRKALAFAGHWMRQGQEVGVAVEVGAADLSDPLLPERILDALSDHGVPSQRLRLIARSQDLLRHEGAVTQTLQRLRIQEIRTDLRELGETGGTLGALWRLPLDGILIDGGLVESARLRREARDVLRATIALCHSLGMTTCVRDLPCRETLDWARRQGCDQALGQPLAGRLAASSVPAWLRSWSEQPARSAV